MAANTRSYRSRGWLNQWKKRETWMFYLAISPWLIGFLLWTAGPMIYSLWLSFTRWDLFTDPVWINFQNYQTLFLDDPDFWQALKVTAIYTFVQVPLGLVGALAIALLMNSAVRGITVFRTIFYLPSVLPAIAVSVLWIWVFNPEFGILNAILRFFGIEGPKWLADPRWALWALIFMSLWSLGGGMIIYLAGLKGIPRALYGAAELDGAGPVQRLWHITLPQISPTIFFDLVMGLIGSFQVFTQAYAMTSGGPQKATLFYMYYLFDMAFIKFRMGYASALAWVLLCLGSVLILIPFFWMVSSALKPDYQIFVFPPQWIPDPIQWSNFGEALTALPFHIYFRNTLIIEAGVIVGTLLSCSIVAYGFARLNAPGRNFWFVVLLSAMMLPSVVTMIPVYLIFGQFGWVNTHLPLIVPSWFGSTFYIFLLRQFFMTIPTDFEEAARIDGANFWQVMVYVILPLAKPALATVAIFTFMGVWNDFMGPLIYLNKPDTYTLALGLNFFKGQYTADWNLLMAASLIMMLPLVILFFAVQRAFIEGITLTGLKG